MQAPTFSVAFETLCLQAADNGRGPVLFGDSVDRARRLAAPFLVGDEFPAIYFEFPLLGDPFLDITILYKGLEADTRINDNAANGCEDAIALYTEMCQTHADINFGFELDTSKPQLPPAAVHFQPRSHLDLVEAFCQALGEPERASLYLDFAKRAPSGWEPSFFGLFRGRPESPLRVCGYIGNDECKAGAQDPSHIAAIFDELGFRAYDDTILERIAQIMRSSEESLDYQFDIYPDGTLGSMVAIDFQMKVEQPDAVKERMESGSGSVQFGHIEGWGAADQRWKLIADAAFARALPVVDENGEDARFSFTLMPGWAKVRWTDRVLQPAKYYLLGNAGILDAEQTQEGD